MEPPIVIEHRDALIYMLVEAAELEHAICCQYLFAAYSLKEDVSEGVDERQLRAIDRWRSVVLQIAGEEMLHLAMVNNLLLSLGAAPRVSRPNLPQTGHHYPAVINLALLPFGERALRHFLYLERPEGINLEDAEGFLARDDSEPPMTADDIVPRPQEFATIGHLYRSIEEGFRHLSDRHGERWLFIGPAHAQATPETLGWADLHVVSDLDSALAALEVIVEQGEGAKGHWRDAHYGRLLEVIGEYLTMRREDPAFEPARPVVPATAHRPVDAKAGLNVTDPVTRQVLDAFNVSYEVLLYCLGRFFGHNEEDRAQIEVLADVAVGIMLRVLQPLGRAVTKLPVGPEHPAVNAGPSFEVFYGSGYLLPHMRAAWALIHERLEEVAAYLERCYAGWPAPPEIARVPVELRRLAGMLSSALPDLSEREVHPPATWVGTRRTRTV